MVRKFPIAWKLLSITLIILLSAMIPIAFQVSNLFSDLFLKREEDINAEQTVSHASRIVSSLDGVLDKSFVIGSLLYRKGVVENSRELLSENQKAIEFNLERLKNIYRVTVYKKEADGGFKVSDEIVNKSILVKYQIPVRYHQVVDKEKPFPVSANFAGRVLVRNRTVESTTPILSIGAPLVTENDTISHVFVADFAFGALQKTLKASAFRTIYIVDEDGQIIAHSGGNESEFLSTFNRDERRANILKTIENNVNSGQNFLNLSGDANYYGAFAKTPYGLTVFSETKESVIKEPSVLARNQVFYITAMVFFGSILFVWLFARRITRPIAMLTKLMFQIGSGELNIRAKSVIKSKDEVGDLAHWFDHMVAGLRERDRVKQLFAKFQGSQIAESLLHEELQNKQSSGQLRQAVVMFCDMRNFTTFSENRSPDEVVKALNEYFKIMIDVVSKNFGVVDKFMGDAIMAVWGAPTTSKDDPVNAVNAAKELQLAIKEKASASSEAFQIEFGIGLHYGEILAGTVGTDQRMEYTVMGDTVNVAARIEAETKHLGISPLFSEALVDKTSGKFDFEFVSEASLKGKKKSVKLFKLIE